MFIAVNKYRKEGASLYSIYARFNSIFSLFKKRAIPENTDKIPILLVRF